ncbi:MAG: ATPase [Hyphomonadaceae bacterium]|nr:ATPase [Hyphomonadaceae bacterium]
MTDAPALPRRFYDSVSVVESGGGFGIKLDARTLRTPGGAPFVAGTRALAELCASEWSAQHEHISPATMPASQLAFAALDRTAENRGDLVDYIAAFGETDLCCHRAEAPLELARRHAALWDPIVAWASEQLGIRLPVIVGIVAASVDPAEIARLRDVAASLSDFQLTALAQTTGLAGSVLIGLALVHGALGPEQAFEAACLDNLWSLERWGEDEEARARLEHHRLEFHAISRFIAALEV